PASQDPPRSRGDHGLRSRPERARRSDPLVARGGLRDRIMAKRKKAQVRKEPSAKLRERAVKILETGTFRETTRRRLKISSGLWANWIRDGKAEREALVSGEIEELGPRGLFVEAIEEAEGKAHDKILERGV